MREGLFPTAKVVEGYDFVGEAWPDGELAPDEDPIDSKATARMSPTSLPGAAATAHIGAWRPAPCSTQ